MKKPATLDDARTTDALSAEIWPLIAPRLAGRPPEIQSAVLAELTAKWLAGFHLISKKATDEFRTELLQLFVNLVRDLIPINELVVEHETKERDATTHG